KQPGAAPRCQLDYRSGSSCYGRPDDENGLRSSSKPLSMEGGRKGRIQDPPWQGEYRRNDSPLALRRKPVSSELPRYLQSAFRERSGTGGQEGPPGTVPSRSDRLCCATVHSCYGFPRQSGQDHLQTGRVIVKGPAVPMMSGRQLIFLYPPNGARDGNRTRINSLEGCGNSHYTTRA